MKKLVFHPIVSSLILFVALSIVANINLASIVVSLIFTYRIFNNWLDPYIFDSQLTRILLTPFFYALILQCVVLLGWLINRSFPVDMSAPLCGLFLFSWYLYEHYYAGRGKAQPFAGKGYGRSNFSDYVSFAIAALIIVMVTLVPVLAGGFSRSSLLNLINGNVDDTTHIALINDRVQFNRAILYHADIAGQTRNPAPYPLGWHAANAMVIKAINPSIKPGTQTIGAYIASKVFWFFLMIFVFVKAVFIFFKVFSKKSKSSSPTAVWLAISSLVFAATFFTDFFRDGFYSFIPQVISILLLGVAVLQINQPSKKSGAFYVTLPLIAILAVGGSLPWLLMLPAILLALIIIVLQRRKAAGIANLAKGLLFNALDHFPLYVLLAISLLVQSYTLSADPSSISFLTGILANGGTPIYSNLMYVFVIVGLVLSIVLMIKKSVYHLSNLLIIIGCMLSLSFIIYEIQVSHLGQAVYYYYKSMSAIMVLAIPIAIVGYALGFENLSGKLNAKTAGWTTLVIMLILVPQLANPASLSYLVGQRDISKQLNQYIYKQISETSTINDYSDKTYTFVSFPDKLFQNDFATTMLKLNKPNSACFNTTRYFLIFQGSLNKGTAAVKRDCQGKFTLGIITDRSGVKELRKAIKSGGLDNTVRIYPQKEP